MRAGVVINFSLRCKVVEGGNDGCGDENRQHSGGLYTCERRYLGLCVSMRIEDIGSCSALGSGQ